MFESTGTTKEKKARDLPKLREGDITRGVPVTPKTNRVTFKELTDDVLTDYRVNGLRSMKDAERRFQKHVLPFFGGYKRRRSAPTLCRSTWRTARTKARRTPRSTANWL